MSTTYGPSDPHIRFNFPGLTTVFPLTISLTTVRPSVAMATRVCDPNRNDYHNCRHYDWQEYYMESTRWMFLLFFHLVIVFSELGKINERLVLVWVSGSWRVSLRKPGYNFVTGDFMLHSTVEVFMGWLGTCNQHHSTPSVVTAQPADDVLQGSVDYGTSWKEAFEGPQQRVFYF